MRIAPLFAPLLAAAALLGSCDDEPEFSHNANLRLTLSADSLLFEPLLAEQPTSTRRLMVWNRSGEDLKIEHIDLRSNGNFQINVNGQAGTSFRNVELLDGDSLYIFVRANIQQLADAKAALVEDSIVLSYNGNTQRIVLSAIAQNAVVLRGHTVQKDTTWTKAQPFLIFDSLNIAPGARLTIEAGTTIFLHHGANICVEGALDVRGNASDPVLMAGDRNDNLVSELPYSALPRQWGGIRFAGTSTGNVIEGLLMRGSTTGIEVDSAATDPAQWRLVLANSELRTSAECLLSCNSARVKAYNTVFGNGGLANVILRGGDYLFNHCTIAETSTYSQRMLEAVALHGTAEQPLTSATFNNCLVFDNRKPAVRASEDSASMCHYTFNHCFVNTTGADSLHFNACVTEGEPGLTADNRLRQYDFHPDSTSAALGIGDSTIATRYPECATDLDGNPRTAGEKPDAGAFVHTPNETKRK